MTFQKAFFKGIFGWRLDASFKMAYNHLSDNGCFKVLWRPSLFNGDDYTVIAPVVFQICTSDTISLLLGISFLPFLLKREEVFSGSLTFTNNVLHYAAQNMLLHAVTALGLFPTCLNFPL